MAQVDAPDFAAAFSRCFAKDAAIASTRGALDLVAIQTKRRGGDPGQAISNMLRSEIQRGIKDPKKASYFPCTVRLVKDYAGAEAADKVFGLGIDWGAVIGSAIAAAGTVYANKLKSEGEEKLLKLQLQEQQAAADAAAAQTQAIAAAKATQQQAAAQGEGIPMWVWIAGGAVALGGAVYFLTRGGGRRRNPASERGWTGFDTLLGVGVGVGVLYALVKGLPKAQALAIEILPQAEPTEEQIEQFREMTLLARVRDPQLVEKVVEALEGANLDHFVEESALGTGIYVGQENAPVAGRMLKQLQEGW